ncbi:protoporphyrinogen oxidase [Nocardioides cavernaquae]|uniref:Coproporphyrinogen III oxidase n=1 Tax=Nocardioides cavernaquae TaxID=2321396 RepID=A0A3A5HBB8_9ACTN|nr:protoporphyrinogen oxidase [Nocardioides cavernaquae]RJS45330.1 protoporphyrinogen oxidase [Nocardioides cavernaquae]
MKSVVVVGGGIAGLAAAWDLSVDHAVTVLEASDRVGGKLRLETVAGVRVDVGAEAMLNRRPEGVALAGELGLSLEHPAIASSRLWTRGSLRALPRSLMGVPLDVSDLASSGVLSDEGLARVRSEPSLPSSYLAGDVSVGALVAERFGDEVVDQLVEPLLGGVYAGRAREISARAAVPQLVAMAARGSLLEAAAALPASDVPVFAGVTGGMGLLPEALAASGRFEVRTSSPVLRVARVAVGFEVTLESDEVLTVDAVVIATPAAASAFLLMDLAPDAAAELARVESADVAVVTFAVREVEARPLLEFGASGFLVPPGERRAIKASTWSFAKWDWVRSAGRGAGAFGEDLLFLRTSLGRHRERALQLADHLLEVGSLTDLHAATGVRLEPVATQVQRWPAGLPQYAVGHLDRVALIRAGVAAVPGLAVCGAAYDGVGIPAVISSARAAADRVRTATGGPAE